MTPFYRRAIRREARLTAMALAGVFVGLLAGPAASLAQGQTGKSPAGHLDLSRPQFDTLTPNYNVSGIQQKQAALTVAEVDGHAITLGDVADAIRELPSMYGQESFETVFPAMLDHLVRHQALVLRAQHQGMDSDPEIKRRMQMAAENVLVNELIQRESTGMVTEKMLLDRYDRDIAGKPGPDEVRVRVIIVPTQPEAAAVIGELSSGGDFAEIARRVSKDPTAGQGGEVNFVPRDKLTPEIGAVAFTLTPGQVTPAPIRTANGWCVLKVEQRRSGPTPSFAAAREGLIAELRREQVPAIVKAAMDGVTVHEYSLLGKQGEGDAAK